VRTPLAGVVTAIVVLLAIYALTAVFFYIPDAALSAVIIHAVLDLLLPPKDVYHFWKTSPLDAVIFIVGVVVIVFSTIEIGVYVTVACSAAILLWRLFKAKGTFVGPVTANVVAQPSASGITASRSAHASERRPELEEKDSVKNEYSFERQIYLPLDHSDGSNSGIEVQHPAPGIFVFRFAAELCYLNASRYLDDMAGIILDETRMTAPNTRLRKGDRQWNDTRKMIYDHENDPRPILKAIVFDCASVHNLDVTTVQAFMDVRAQLNRHTAPYQAPWYFASVNSAWARRALVAANLNVEGEKSSATALEPENYRFDVASLTAFRDDSLLSTPASGRADASSDGDAQEKGISHGSLRPSQSNSLLSGATRTGVIVGLNRPYFFVDVQSAVNSAMAAANEST
jgi:solute carrier family 26 (sodium-independent sulfate anion transporter), member 11